ncbi:HAMP domain-containing sensor histidine kinase [Wukongibacter baidiensis]|uniref:sensor histidine kinase n=1 Tax=Wukongibacter baidiensis TaxID=1723361 RepID=UPI003D7F483D
MKRASLDFKLMLAFIGVILFFSVISYMILIETFQKYYHEDIYRVLEDNGDRAKTITDIEEFVKSSDEDDRSIERIYWIKVNGLLTRKVNRFTSNLTEDIIYEIESNILKQTDFSRRYSLNVEGRKLFYIITKFDTDNTVKSMENLALSDQWNVVIQEKTVNNNAVYRATLRWEPLDNSLKEQLYIQLIIVLLLTLLAMLIGFFFLSSYITRPIKQLARSVKRISARKFDTPITINRNDEIGFLANTVEEMRKELLSYDEQQKLKMHSISHELKTPIMIIQSYVDGLKRGLYPDGTPESSYEVIDEECKRLQKLVSNLLYIQRLDYFNSEFKHKEKVNVRELIKEVLDSLTLKLNNINTELHLSKVFILADYSQMKIIIENILSNQIRYAQSLIRISLKKHKSKVTLEFYNDGKPLEDENNIFNIFKKGEEGQSGLGLYIVKRLVDMNGGRINAYNEEVGVIFKIEWDLK